MVRFNLSAPEQWLCQLIADIDREARQAILAQLRVARAASEVIQLAKSNGVAAQLYHVLPYPYVPGEWADEIVDLHQQMTERISSFLDELDVVAAKLLEESVPVILVENGSLARAFYPCAGCFTFGDLDLLIKYEHIPVMHHVLTMLGYTALGPNSESAALPEHSAGRVEYERIISGGHSLRLNFQWSLVARRWFSQAQEPSLESLLMRSVPIQDSAVRILCPEDILFQLAIHNASHTYVRKPGIRLHLDVERFVRRSTVDWNEFVAMVERYHVKTVVYFSLAIPVALFDTPVPGEVLSQLAPSAWKEQLISRWIQRAGLFNPQEKKFSRSGHILFTMLLYDDVRGLWRGVFPDRQWLKQRYGFRHSWLLPYYHSRWLIDLIFRRATT